MAGFLGKDVGFVRKNMNMLGKQPQNPWFLMVHHGSSWFIMVHHGSSWFIMVHRYFDCYNRPKILAVPHFLDIGRCWDC